MRTADSGICCHGVLCADTGGSQAPKAGKRARSSQTLIAGQSMLKSFFKTAGNGTSTDDISNTKTKLTTHATPPARAVLEGLSPSAANSVDSRGAKLSPHHRAKPCTAIREHSHNGRASPQLSPMHSLEPAEHGARSEAAAAPTPASPASVGGAKHEHTLSAAKRTCSSVTACPRAGSASCAVRTPAGKTAEAAVVTDSAETLSPHPDSSGVLSLTSPMSSADKSGGREDISPSQDIYELFANDDEEDEADSKRARTGMNVQRALAHTRSSHARSGFVFAVPRPPSFSVAEVDLAATRRPIMGSTGARATSGRGRQPGGGGRGVRGRGLRGSTGLSSEMKDLVNQLEKEVKQVAGLASSARNNAAESNVKGGLGGARVVEREMHGVATPESSNRCETPVTVPMVYSNDISRPVKSDTHKLEARMSQGDAPSSQHVGGEGSAGQLGGCGSGEVQLARNASAAGDCWEGSDTRNKKSPDSSMITIEGLSSIHPLSSGGSAGAEMGYGSGGKGIAGEGEYWNVLTPQDTLAREGREQAAETRVAGPLNTTTRAGGFGADTSMEEEMEDDDFLAQLELLEGEAGNRESGPLAVRGGEKEERLDSQVLAVLDGAEAAFALRQTSAGGTAQTSCDWAGIFLLLHPSLSPPFCLPPSVSLSLSHTHTQIDRFPFLTCLEEGRSVLPSSSLTTHTLSYPSSLPLSASVSLWLSVYLSPSFCLSVSLFGETMGLNPLHEVQAAQK